MFSRRLPADLEPISLARALDAARSENRALIDLTVSNPTAVKLATVPPPLDALGTPDGYRYDPAPCGTFRAREAIAGYYSDRGVSVDPASIVLTSGTSESYAHLFRLLAEPGDAFLAPRPSYPLFAPLASMESVRLATYPLHYDGRWWLDRDALDTQAAKSARGLILVNPNNPTGSILNGEETESVVDWAARQGAPLIVDEVFADFGTTWAALPSFAGRADVPTFSLSGLSKAAGLPQLKLAWIVVAGPEDFRRGALERLEWAADAFLSVAGPVQSALPRLLAYGKDFRREMRKRIGINEDRLRDLLGESSVDALSRDGGWSAVLRLPRIRSEEDWCLKLLDRDVVVHPGHFYDFEEEAYLVVSLLPEPELFERGIKRIAELAG